MEEGQSFEVQEILDQTISAIHRRDTDALHALSDRVVDLASVSPDQSLLQTAVVIYALSKLLSRVGYAPTQREKAIDHLKKMHAKVDSVKGYARSIADCIEFVAKLDKKFKVYVDYILESAQAMGVDMLTSDAHWPFSDVAGAQELAA